jgi:hypothetical protein
MNFAREFGLRREVGSKRKRGGGKGEVLHSHWVDLRGGGLFESFLFCGRWEEGEGGLAFYVTNLGRNIRIGIKTNTTLL